MLEPQSPGLYSVIAGIVPRFLPVNGRRLYPLLPGPQFNDREPFAVEL
jgi:hypothetical protein